MNNNNLLNEIELSEKKTLFLHYYVRERNVSKSARLTGISRTHAYRFLKDKSFIEALNFILNNSALALNVNDNVVLGSAVNLLNANMADYVNPDGTFKKVNELTREQAYAIKKLTLKEDESGVQTTLELYPKDKVLTLLGGRFGTFQKIDCLSDDDLSKKSMAELLEMAGENG